MASYRTLGINMISGFQTLAEMGELLLRIISIYASLAGFCVAGIGIAYTLF